MTSKPNRSLQAIESIKTEAKEFSDLSTPLNSLFSCCTHCLSDRINIMYTAVVLRKASSPVAVGLHAPLRTHTNRRIYDRTDAT